MYKRVLDTITLLVVIVGLYFTWDQAHQFNRAQNLTNWIDLLGHQLEVDKVLVDNPGLRKYFVDKADITKIPEIKDSVATGNATKGTVTKDTFKKCNTTECTTTEDPGEFDKVTAIGDLMLDHFDNVMSRLEYNEINNPEDSEQREAWRLYIESTLKSSPVLCRMLQKNMTSYTKRFQCLARNACTKK